MKKGLKILCAALSLTAIMSFSAFAAETRKEYRAEAEPIRTEMKAMEEQMDALRESNKNSMEHFKNIHLNKKETGNFRSVRGADPSAPRGAGADPDLCDADP